ncbi:MAG: translation elongation factor Ts [Actinomycetota bacterium]
MAEISAGDVKKLREQTGAGMMDCKKALTDASGDFDKARILLRERGVADAAKRSGKEATEGLITTYLHAPTPGVPAKIGVMLELQTETDFVAKTDATQELAKSIAMHIAAAKPAYLSVTDVPEDVLATERELAKKKVEGKPEKVVEQAMEGAVKKFAKLTCLLEQPWIRDEKTTIGQLVATHASNTGENIAVRRFVRYEVAETLD